MSSLWPSLTSQSGRASSPAFSLMVSLVYSPWWRRLPFGGMYSSRWNVSVVVTAHLCYVLQSTLPVFKDGVAFQAPPVSQASSRGEAKDSALLSSRDADLLEPPEGLQGSPASSSVWRDKMPANLENSAVATGLEKVSFHSNPKERQCQRTREAP